MSDELQVLNYKASRKRIVMHDTLYVLRRITENYNGLQLSATPEADFDDVLVVLNLAVAKLDAIDAHPSGQADLTAIHERHLRAVD